MQQILVLRTMLCINVLLDIIVLMVPSLLKNFHVITVHLVMSLVLLDKINVVRASEGSTVVKKASLHQRLPAALDTSVQKVGNTSFRHG